MNKQNIAISIAYIIILIVLCLIALPIIASINLFNFMVLTIVEVVWFYATARLWIEKRKKK